MAELLFILTTVFVAYVVFVVVECEKRKKEEAKQTAKPEAKKPAAAVKAEPAPAAKAAPVAAEKPAAAAKTGSGPCREAGGRQGVAG
ncbi:hypothetical protein Q9L42_004975 [Methylomarinum sp. Ch1-1]|uniref:Uncharacterized protein n=1 Tax=Methylomarinum roseum TaxID=3067653 RepID=A0AAU7NWX1_9GAMM